MADIVSSKKRSWMMSQVSGKDTKPELRLRSALHQLGYRFRLHSRNLPGTPDLVLKKYRTVIFVNGCFWHRHKGCKKRTTPKVNCEFWAVKFEQNVKRDRRNYGLLRKAGWNVVIVWECELISIERVCERIEKSLMVTA